MEIHFFFLPYVENPPLPRFHHLQHKIMITEDHNHHHPNGKKHIYHIQQHVAEVLLIKKEIRPPYWEYSACLIFLPLLLCREADLSNTLIGLKAIAGSFKMRYMGHSAQLL